MKETKRRIEMLKKRPVRSNAAIWCGGIVLLLVVAFGYYVQAPNTLVPNPDSKKWGYLALAVLLADIALLRWGIGPDPDEEDDWVENSEDNDTM